MIRTRVDLEFLDHLVCQFVLRQHPTDRVIDQIFRFSLFTIAIALKAKPWISGVLSVVAIIHLLAGHADFLRVHDDHKVTAINVRSVRRTMLAHQDDSDITCQSTEDLVGGVDDIPLLLDLAFLGHGCWLGHHGINLWFEWIGIENRC